MEVQAIPEVNPGRLGLTNQVPLAFLERLIIGAIAGAIGGIVAAWIAFPMELGAILGLVLVPLFAVVGATCGVISKRHSWATVRPIVWAMVGGLILGVDTPTGWVIGGAVGNLINGMLSGSMINSVKKTFVGLGLGVLGWAMVYGYLIAFIFVVEQLTAE
jgi:hypothetical protein